MKQILKVLVGILVLAAILFGVYMVLPEYPQNFMKSFVQPVVNSQAKLRIDQVKSLQNEKEAAPYQEILESHTKSSFWIYDQTVDAEIVTFYGNGASINIKDVPDHEDHLYTSTSVKFEFVIKGNTLQEVRAYLGTEKILQDEVICEVMLRQLHTGSTY